MAKKILLADDSVTIQKVVELTFADGDYEVAAVSEGSLVLDRVRTLTPDILLLDVILPGENGYDICDAMKRVPDLASIPVLLLTGTFEPFDRRRADAVGADGHLTKPFESQVLVSRVLELLDRGGRPLQDEPGLPAPRVDTEAPPTPEPTGAPADPPGGPLTDQDVERIARRVAERIGDAVVREVAWEVVPDLAERLVRQRIRQIEDDAD